MTAGFGCSSPCYATVVDAPDPTRPASADDERLAAIVAGARATRRPPSRAMWIAAALVGAICAVGFVLLFVAGVAGEAPAEAPDAPAAAGPTPDRPRASRGAGCAGGLGLGLGAGLAIGFWLGRRQGGDHSSRSRP
jgi:hypothetical protein